MRRDHVEAIVAAQRAGDTIALATRLSDGVERLIRFEAGEPTPDSLATRAFELAAGDTSAAIEVEGERWFVNVFSAPITLVIVGAVHIAQPLSMMAKALSWQVTIADPREGFATRPRFPETEIRVAWPDEALEQVKMGPRTAVVALTHDPKLDDPALVAALRSKAFYVGALGSRRTHAARCERLRAQGFREDDIARIRGPVGLSIKARSPAEIAVSIAAQIVETLRSKAP